MSKAVQHLQSITSQDEYGTPMDVYLKGVKLAAFTPLLDVCTNLFNKKCDALYTLQHDALSKQWPMSFFMNPPYSKVKQFMRYAYEQHKKWNVNGLILVYAKTDTRWWHEYVQCKAEVHFIQGRIKFNDYYGRPTQHPAPYPSCWVIYRSTGGVMV